MSALERLESLGSAMGQSVIAGDLAALIAHKRAASLRRGSSVSTRSARCMSRRGEHVRSHRQAPPLPQVLPATEGSSQYRGSRPALLAACSATRS